MPAEMCKVLFCVLNMIAWANEVGLSIVPTMPVSTPFVLT